jgi:ketosteroid isomerase-like protein
VAKTIAGWFSDSTVLDLIDSRTGDIGGKLYLSYRFHGVEEGKPYAIEQHLYCTLSDGKIRQVDLLCSGFTPRPAG